MSSDSEHVFPSSRAPSPPTSPYTSPLKRPLQESSAETPRRRCRPPPTPSFANEFASLSRLEYGGNDTTSEVGQDQDLRRSFHLTQLKRSTLHLEKCWVKQKIEEHEITLQALKERMSNIEENITSTTFKVDRLHCCMDRLGVSIPDMPDLIAASIFLSEVIDMDTVKIPKTLSAYTTTRDRLFTLDFLNFPALDSRHAARECESNWLQHQIDYLFRPRDYLHAQSYGELCTQTPASHLSDGQRGVRSASRQLTQAPTGPMATVTTQPQASRTIEQRMMICSVRANETGEVTKTMRNGCWKRVDAQRGNERRRGVDAWRENERQRRELPFHAPRTRHLCARLVRQYGVERDAVRISI
ncbi:hypothetical protein EDB86DRAFT_2829778 [Lactarius hatsudake]|nr:hypothetical protein EDB86DRAFT_2829778 [Lactarius hatsudake]